MNQESQKSFGRKGGKSGLSNWKNYNLPREAFTESKQLDTLSGNWKKRTEKESAEGIVGMETSQQ